MIISKVMLQGWLQLQFFGSEMLSKLSLSFLSILLHSVKSQSYAKTLLENIATNLQLYTRAFSIYLEMLIVSSNEQCSNDANWDFPFPRCAIRFSEEILLCIMLCRLIGYLNRILIELCQLLKKNSNSHP